MKNFKFRVMNPRRRKRRMRLRLKRNSKGRFLPRSKTKKTSSPMRIRRRRRSRRTFSRRRRTMRLFRRRSIRRRRSVRSYRRRRANPYLAVANPRRRRRTRRFSIRRKMRRFSNPGFSIRGIKSTGFGRETLTMAAGGVLGFLGAKKFRDFAGAYVVPAGATPRTEGAINAVLKLVAGGIGGILLRRFNPRIAQGFAVGAATSALFDVWALITGTPMSLSEYVAPRALVNQVRRSGRGMSCGMGAYTGFFPVPRPGLSSAYPSAYRRAF